MINISLRNLRKSDLKNLYGIIINPKFIHIVLPKSFESYKKYFLKKLSRRKEGLEFHYAIIFKEGLIGVGGIKINDARPYIGEITYIIDKIFWGKGVATEVARKLETICFNKLKLTKTEIWMNPKNLASKKIAVKLGYKKEGLLKKKIKERKEGLCNVCVYSKLAKIK